MALPPIRRQIVVAATPDIAFEVFTGEIGAWWPLASHSVHGSSATVAFRDGRLVERHPDGDAVWGTVLDWDPPSGFRMTWHPGSDPEGATEVEVSFTPVTDDRTLVTLEHRGWERRPDARAEYGRGWPVVLGGYEERFTDSEPSSRGRLARVPAHARTGGRRAVRGLHPPGLRAPPEFPARAARRGRPRGGRAVPG